MRIAIAELLAFAYNLEYLMRLTKLKYTHIFIVENVFAVLNFNAKELTVRWLIEKQPS